MSEKADGEKVAAMVARKRKLYLDSNDRIVKRACYYNDIMRMLMGSLRLRSVAPIKRFLDKPVNRRAGRRAGPYMLGPALGKTTEANIIQYLGRKPGSDDFVTLKILMLGDTTPLKQNSPLSDGDSKMLLHNELSLLTMLAGQKGVIQARGIFTDKALEEDRFGKHPHKSLYTGHVMRRIVLALDCVTPHEFCDKSKYYVDLQQHIINMKTGKRLKEGEYLAIFRKIVGVVESLHNLNVVHRDLRLGNIILNMYTKEVTIINFGLAKHLLNENDLLSDQQGSPAYISPEVLHGNPYKGKPIDVWALGVILYLMVYGHFPFYESSPMLLYKMIKTGEFEVPLDLSVTFEVQDLIRGMLEVNTTKRLTIQQVRVLLDKVVRILDAPLGRNHVVPGTRDPNMPIKNVDKFCRLNHNFDQMVPQLGEKQMPVMVQPWRNDWTEKRSAQPKPVPSTPTPLPDGSRELSGQPFAAAVLEEEPRRRRVRFDTSGLTLPTATPLVFNAPILRRVRFEAETPLEEETVRRIRATMRAVQQMPSSPSIQRQPRRVVNQVNDSNVPNANVVRPAQLPSIPTTLSRRQTRVVNASNSNQIIFSIASNLIPPLTVSTSLQTVPGYVPRPTPAARQPDGRTRAPVLLRSTPGSRAQSVCSLFYAICQRSNTLDPSTLVEFDGFITNEFATRLATWLVGFHSDHTEVRRTFGTTIQDNLPVRAYKLFRNISITVELVDDQYKVNRMQAQPQLTLMTELLLRSGYDGDNYLVARPITPTG